MLRSFSWTMETRLFAKVMGQRVCKQKSWQRYVQQVENVEQSRMWPYRCSFVFLLSFGEMGFIKLTETLNGHSWAYPLPDRRLAIMIQGCIIKTTVLFNWSYFFYCPLVTSNPDAWPCWMSCALKGNVHIWLQSYYLKFWNEIVRTLAYMLSEGDLLSHHTSGVVSKI